MKRICTHRNKKHQKLPYLGTLKEKPAVRVGLRHILRKKICSKIRRISHRSGTNFLAYVVPTHLTFGCLYFKWQFQTYGCPNLNEIWQLV